MDRRGEGSGHDRAGLVALGLIMELVGSVVAAYLIVKTLEPVLNRAFVGHWYPVWTWEHSGNVQRDVWERLPLHVMLLATIGILRALVHRRAGRAVLYRSGDATAAVGIYVAVALGHTALCVLAFRIYRDGQSLAWAVGACLSVGWPVALLLAIRRPAIRLGLRSGRSATVASAPDQVATLMVFFGLVGCLVALFAVYAAMDGSTGSWPSFLTIGVAALLFVRSIVHAWVGARLVSRDPACSEPPGLSRYLTVALGAAALSWAAILILLCRVLNVSPRELPTHHLELGRSALTVYLLFVWPLLLGRLERVRAVAPAPTPTASRSPAALLALGWLLLAAGAVQVGFAALSLHLGADFQWVSRSFIDLPTSGEAVSRGPWLQLLIAVPQVWVAVELLRGSRRRRAAATLYAACASVATVLAVRADMDILMRAIGLGLPDATALVVYLPVAFSLLVPIGTLVFVQQQLRREASRAPVDSNGGEG